MFFYKVTSNEVTDPPKTRAVTEVTQLPTKVGHLG